MIVYRLSAAAQEDIVELLAHTDTTYGEIARRRYERLLVTALRDLAADPRRIGSVARPEFGEFVRSYHLRYSRERARTEHGIVLKPRHLLLYRVARTNVVAVGRVLHDAMELERHLPTEYGDEGSSVSASDRKA